MKIMLSLTVILILVLLPLSTIWWLYFPASAACIFLIRRVYSTMLASFILDAIYFGGANKHLPIFMGASLVMAVFFILFQDKLRYAPR